MICVVIRDDEEPGRVTVRVEAEPAIPADPAAHTPAQRAAQRMLAALRDAPDTTGWEVEDDA